MYFSYFSISNKVSSSDTIIFTFIFRSCNLKVNVIDIIGFIVDYFLYFTRKIGGIKHRFRFGYIFNMIDISYFYSQIFFYAPILILINA